MKSRKEKVQQLQKKYSLTEMKDVEYERDQLIFYLQKDLNEKILLSDLGTSQGGRNTFAQGLRTLQSNITGLIVDQDDKEYLRLLSEEYGRTSDIDDQVNILFDRYDLLVKILEGAKQKEYVATEDESGGVISEFIRNRILTRDLNYILGIFGPPGSGKSTAGGRIAKNVTRDKTLFDLDDVIFGKEKYLDRIKLRRDNKILKGSVQIIDEGGSDLDAMTWWERDVQGAVQVLRQQRFQNTLTVIISPEYKDIVSRARGLFHAILIPWYDWKTPKMELSDNDNIDERRGMSSWRFLTLDVDPITGDLYKKRMKVAGGYVRKVEIRRTAKRFETGYKVKSQKEKIKTQDRELEKYKKKRLKEGLAVDRAPIVAKILKNLKDYTGKRGGIALIKIQRKEKVGRTIAEKLKDEVEEELERRKKK